MTGDEFEALRRRWYGVARASGFHDIEAPSASVSGFVSRHAPTERQAQEAQLLDEGRAFLWRHRFRNRFEREVWEMHVEGVSARETARRLRSYRKKVDKTVARLTKQMLGELAPEPRRGRPRDPESLRSEGMRLTLRLCPRAAFALDRIRATVGGTASKVVRETLIAVARKTV